VVSGECRLGHIKLTSRFGVCLRRNALMAILGQNHYPDINQVGLIVRLLLGAGANVNSPPSEMHGSALAAAIFEHNISCVDELLANGANVNAHDCRFVTPLIAAACRGHLDITKKLVDKGADLTLTCEKFGWVLSRFVRGLHGCRPLSSQPRS